MSGDNDEPNGLLDDDPALDCILYEEMNKEERRPGGKGGCLVVRFVNAFTIYNGSSGR
jgi:hypothetical protein